MTKIFLKIWDGRVNPFAKEERSSALKSLHVPKNPNQKATEEAVWTEQLRAQLESSFEQMFLPTKGAADPTEHLRTESGSVSAKDADHQLHLFTKWQERLATLRASWHQRPLPTQPPPADHQDVEQQLKALLKGDKTVQVWIHPSFARPFTAIGPFPRDHLFTHQREHEDLLQAALIVHEAQHLNDGAQQGWLSFQKQSTTEIERPALQAELNFLRHQSADQKTDWAPSALRAQWNFALAAEQLPLLQQGDANAASILEIVLQLDP